VHDIALGQSRSRARDARIGDETSHEIVVHAPLVRPTLQAGYRIIRAQNSRKQAASAKAARAVAFAHQLAHVIAVVVIAAH
jgi:hypothetical protein